MLEVKKNSLQARSGYPTEGQKVLLKKLVESSGVKPYFSKINTAWYLDSELFSREIEHVIHKVPLPIIPSSLLPEKGMAVPHSNYGIPLIVSRDKDGVVRIFLNACSHRGSKIMTSPDPVKRNLLVCPYHGWSFKLNGCLAGVPKEEIFSCLNRAEHSLVEFPAFESGGLIWGILQAGVQGDFSSIRNGIQEDMDALGIGDMHCYARRTHEVKGNWKLILEAFQEIYHVPFLHKNTVAPMFSGRSVHDYVGRHVRFATERGRVRSCDINLDAPLSSLSHDVTFSYLLFPVMIVVVSPTYVNLLICSPQDPGTTLVENIMLIPQHLQTADKNEHWESSWKLLDEGVYEKEDIFAVEKQQQGLSSGILKTLSIGGLEKPIEEFQKNILNCFPEDYQGSLKTYMNGSKEN